MSRVVSVVIWCDLAPEIGVGHLMRCIALAEEIVARGESVVFLVDAPAVPFAAAQLDVRGFPAVPPPATLDEQLAEIDRHDPLAVVVDSYRLPPEVYAALRARHRTLAFVDGEIGGREADLYLDQNIGAESDDRTLADGAERLAGLRYALMREGVLQHRPGSPDDHVDSEPPKVLAFFGGTDAYGAAPLLVPALVATGEAFRLSVVAATDERRAALAAIEPGPGQEIHVIAPTDRIAELVGEADLVVSAAGTSSWELLCLGAAVAFVCVADNQAEAYDRIAAQGLGYPLGLLGVVPERAGEVTATLRAALADAEGRRRMRRAGWELVDGRGRSRVADRLLAAER